MRLDCYRRMTGEVPMPLGADGMQMTVADCRRTAMCGNGYCYMVTFYELYIEGSPYTIRDFNRPAEYEDTLRCVIVP